MNKKEKFYVTTPIYYVTAAPHLGSLYSTVIADVAARWNRLQGKKVFMLTGTDEHGQKIVQAAAKAGKQPQEFVDSFIHAYKETWARYTIDYTHFIRTTDPMHVKAVQHWILQMIEQGDIYKGFYTGWYCISCETFVTSEDKDKAPPCPSCRRQTEFTSEETYFFRLSAYQDRLLRFYQQHPEFIAPKERLHEVITFVKAGLTDLSISRTTVSWGIPFPGDPKHTVYVWADALNNYITAVGYAQVGKLEEFEFWWPADAQIMGKDIVRFHAVYWPAFLMATGLELPKRLIVHGWITVNHQKMSKSLGNVIDPLELSEKYGTDVVRYYLMRYLSITHDSDFSIQDLERAATADLANDLGNLLNRIIQLADKHGIYEVKAPVSWSSQASTLLDTCWTAFEEMEGFMRQYEYHMALGRLWHSINAINGYFHTMEPWKLAATDKGEFEQVLSVAANCLYKVAVLLWPFMPHTMEQLLNRLGKTMPKEGNLYEVITTQPWQSLLLKPGEPLFKKYDTDMERKAVKQGESMQTVQSNEHLISINDFNKVELVVGTIQQCEAVPKSDKLYRLLVDFGDKGERQILSGVRVHFTPEQLIDKQCIFVFNLPSRMMMGLESQGMLLVTQDNAGNWHMVTTAGVPNGSRLR